MFNSIIEKVLIGIVLSIILLGSYVSFKANNTLNDIQDMYFDAPINKKNEHIA
jgi:hypothetical protein